MFKNRKKNLLATLAATAGGMLLMPFAAADGHIQELGEFAPIVEINATDGDVGFHVLIDGDPWKRMSMYNPDGRRILKASPSRSLREQGITEFFIESAEPPCWFDEEDPEADPEEIATVADFVERFAEGTYSATGWTIEGERLAGEAELTHNLPAAPDMSVDTEGGVTLSWEGGDDLGECAFPDTIPNPADVEVVRWEVVVEPNEDELEGGELPEGVVFAKFTAQLPAEISSLDIPAVYIDTYLAQGVNQFKGEVGAKEEGGNQTFTEFEFCVGEDC